MAPRPPQPVTVTGGSAGVVAHCDEMRALAGRFGAAGEDTLAAVLALHALLVHPALLRSIPWDPLGFAEVEADLVAALDLVPGLSWAGLECAGLDLELRAAAAAYEVADHLATDVHDLVLGVLDAGPAAAQAAIVLARTGDPLRAAQAAIALDPALADEIVDLLGLPFILRVLAEALPDGRGIAVDTGVDRGGRAARPPRGLTDVVAGLGRRSDDPRHGAIDVRTLTMADGRHRVIVDITGTRSWDPLPTGDVTSLTTNGRALVGVRTAYEGGVLAAMRRAGVRPTDDVMLVGHSQGGLVAVTTARDARASGEFHVTHVITAGAPIGRTVGGLPRGVQVLALENAADVVPHLDGRANPDRPNVVTASSRHGDGTVVGDHDVARSYLPLAADVEASSSRSLRDFLGSARGYFDAVSVETHTFQVVRRY